jgi:hypothetical protein
MIDLKSYHDTVVMNPDGTPEVVHYGADYVHGQRTLSPEFRATLDAKFEAEYGYAPVRDSWGGIRDYHDSQAMYRLMDVTPGPARNVTKMEGAH